MKVVEGFKLRPLGEEFILVPEGGGLVNFNKMVSFNKSAAFLWNAVSGMDSFSVETLADLLVGEYGIDLETALRDSAAIADKWVESGIVER